MRPTPPCWEAAAWTARSTVPRDRSFWLSAAHCTAVPQAKITKGYKLPAKWVIHTVGPVWHGGEKGEADLLRGCYENSLRLAVEHGCKSVAFPAISTGVYRYPLEQAAEIAVKTVADFLAKHPDGPAVTFVCFQEQAAQLYQTLLGERTKA